MLFSQNPYWKISQWSILVSIYYFKVSQQGCMYYGRGTMVSVSRLAVAAVSHTSLIPGGCS